VLVERREGGERGRQKSSINGNGTVEGGIRGMRVWFAFGGVLKQALLRKAGGDGRQAARWWRRKKGAAEPLMPLIHQIFHLTSNAPVSERIHVSRPVLAPRLLCPRVYGYL
jgi:hypothetical protein